MYIVLIQVILATINWSGAPMEDLQSSTTMTLFDFNATENATWQIVNDGVMGGRSKGYFEIEANTLVFTGTLVTRGGGFTSVRTNGAFDLQGYDGVELRVRGNGRRFDLAVNDTARWRGRVVSRRATFPTTDTWTWVRVPFRALGTTIFGRTVNAPAINLTQVNRIGFFIADGIDGDFRLEVDEVRVYKKER